MRRKSWLLTLYVVAVLSVAGAASAQDEVIADGLNNPRHIAYDSDGTLYIAEGGSGGDEEVEGPYGLATAGLTSQITAVSPDGEQAVLMGDLVSLDQGFGNINGASALLVTDESYWVTLGVGPKTPPEGAQVEAVLEIDRETLEVQQVIDVRSFEEANNPDEDVEIVSNPADLALAEDSTLYIADASGNFVVTWTAEDGLQLFAAWPVDQEGVEPAAVPTSVGIGPDGDIYVGFLSGFPFPTGGTRIERYSPDGELKQTYEGLTLVTDVLVTDDGVIYAVEMAGGFGEAGYIPNSGRVVEVTEEGPADVMTGLNFPYGLAQDADGNLVVTVNSAFSEPDSGRVIPVVMGGVVAPPEVVETPEVATTEDASGD